tara:strand:+ start:63 stop:1901 length:1839 start_codon:yes stop_codon:yes gene_type:complete
MLTIAERYLDRGTLMETDMTVTAMKDDIRALNEAGFNLPLTGTKAQLRSNINDALLSWHTEETKNRSSNGFADCVKHFVTYGAHRAPGHASIHGVNAKIVIGHSREWAESKDLVMRDILGNYPEHADERTGRLKTSVGISHALVKATDAKAEGTTEAGISMAAAFGGMKIETDKETAGMLSRVIDDMVDDITGKTRNDDGLFTAQIVDRLVEEIQERAPEGYTIGAIFEGISFDSFILYDFTIAPKSVDDARFPPSGMFRVEWQTPRNVPKDKRKYLDSNPPPQAFMNKTIGYYLKHTHRWFGQVTEFRAWVLQGFNLLPLATPFTTVAKQVNGFNGEETKYVPFSEHGIPRDKGIAAVMNLEVLDFGACKKMICEAVRKSPFLHTVGWKAFVPGSPTDVARNTERSKAKKAEQAWYSGGKKGRKPRGPSQHVALTPDNVKDLKKMETIKVWVDLVALQGDSASLMNMIATEERQVEAGSGIMPNIVKILKFAKQGRTLSADETKFVECLQTLREHSTSKPWGWVNGVRGVSSGVDDTNLPAWAKTNPKGRKTTKGRGTLNFAGEYGHNHGCLQLEMTTFAGAPCIGMYIEDLTPEAISNREKFGHRRHRSQ